VTVFRKQKDEAGKALLDIDVSELPSPAGRLQPFRENLHLPAAVLSALQPLHYSLIARSQALRRYFPDGSAWEAAAPEV
jgi:hypothetical protein